ncbi:MAG: ABC transporter substrate-binding protein [Candidatus Methanomethylophilaceae archaeon]|nr:ABC transporter substrate-binding protein [Candidatus Methanomethylophilaceae archaeon]
MLNLKFLLFIVAAIAALGIIFGLGIHEDDPVPDDYYTPDASEVAASLSSDYSGFFGDVLYLADGETKAEATDFYPNGSSRSPTENYVTFKALADKAAAKEMFETAKPSYESQVGRTVMGSVVAGTEVKGNLDDAFGYYNNFNMGTPSAYLYYMGYYGNVFFESYFYLTGAMISEVEISDLAKNIYKAIKNPISVDYANRYLEPAPESDVTCRLLVYGNANNDNYLDQADLSFIESIAKGSWDSAKYPYADANVDGKVDSADVEVVKKFLNGQSATMYYTDWNLDVSSIQYPLSGKIAGTYDSSLWFAQIVGVYDDVKYLCRTQAYIDALREDMFPGASKNIVAQGTNGNFDPEKLIANNIKVVIGDPYGITAEYLEKVSKVKSIQTVLIPENRDINGLNWSNSVVTLGVMFNKQDNTKEYVEYIEKVERKISESVASAVSGETELSYLLIYAQPGSTGVGLDVHSTGSTQYGDVMNVENLPLTCAIQNSSSNWVDSSVEDVLAIDPDVIIFTAWGPFQNNYTQQQYIDFINEMLQDYKTSSAYKNGRVYSISYEVYGTLPGISGIPYLGSQIWPSLFDEDEGVALLQEYFDKFTYISGTDVTTVPTLLPLTLADIEGSETEASTATLMIYGNANNDDTIDASDLEIVKSVISGAKSLADYPYADANADGAVNQKDVDLVNDLINRKQGITVYVSCLDVNGDDTAVAVKYPLRNVVTYATNMQMPALFANGGQYVAGYFASSYDVAEASIKDAKNLEGNQRQISDAAWANFTALDASLASKGGIGAILIDHSGIAQFTESRMADLKASGIPMIDYTSADAVDELQTVLVLGFLFGGDCEKVGREYAKIGWDVKDKVSEAVSQLSADDKVSYICGTMYIYICGASSSFNTSAATAGGIPYADLNADFASKYTKNSTKMASTEALSNYTDAGIFINNRSMDWGLDESEYNKQIVETWDHNNSGVSSRVYFKEFEDKLVYVNNLLPGGVKIAYMAHAMYGDLFSREWADSVLQSYIDLGSAPLAGQTLDSVLAYITFDDYKAIAD